MRQEEGFFFFEKKKQKTCIPSIPAAGASATKHQTDKSLFASFSSEKEESSLGPIAIVAHTHPSLTKGGAELAAYALYEGLRAAGTEAIFIAACPEENRNRVTFATDHEYVVLWDRRRTDEFYQLGAPQTARALLDILARHHVRLVNFQHFTRLGVNVLNAVAAAKIPFVLTLHEFIAVCANQGQMVTRPDRRLCAAAGATQCVACFPEHTETQFTLRKELVLAALSKAAAFVSPSRFLADRMIAWGLPGEKFAIIENGLRAFPAHPAPPRPHSSGEPYVFGFFGQITPYKGVDTILAALDLIAQRRELAGRIVIRIHGALAGQTEEFARRFATAMATYRFAIHTGAYRNEDIFALMAECDYVLVPSTWWENAPVVIQEAFAAGRPVICTGIGGMAEKVRHRLTGLHVRPGDPDHLVQTLTEAADPDLLRALSAGLTQPPSRDEMAISYATLFHRVAAAT